MRVLVVHNRYRSTQPSGENAVVDEEVQLLAGAGCDVERLEVSSDEIAGWSATRRATLPLRVIWSKAGEQLTARAIDRFRPDVAHFHNTFPLLSPAALRTAHRSTAVVQTVHNFRALCPAATFFRSGAPCEECLGRLPLPAIRHACYRDSRSASATLVAMISVHRAAGTWTHAVDRFLFPSAFAMAKHVEAGWHPGKLGVKYNTAADSGGLREGAGRGFVCLTRFTPEKGAELLLDAWKVAFPAGEEELLLIGAGDDEARIQRDAAGVPGVRLTGRLRHDDALEHLSGARALLLQSRCYEVFPRAVAEAYSAGVPVIAPRLGALPELVEDGVTGLLFESGSAHSLASAIERIASSDELVIELGRNARAAYEAKYSPARTTADLLAHYEVAMRRAGELIQVGA
jgi:glycosyltransferase involved in cell wall biosynthesis